MSMYGKNQYNKKKKEKKEKKFNQKKPEEYRQSCVLKEI